MTLSLDGDPRIQHICTTSCPYRCLSYNRNTINKCPRRRTRRQPNAASPLFLRYRDVIMRTSRGSSPFRCGQPISGRSTRTAPDNCVAMITPSQSHPYLHFRLKECRIPAPHTPNEKRASSYLGMLSFRGCLLQSLALSYRWAHRCLRGPLPGLGGGGGGVNPVAAGRWEQHIRLIESVVSD